MFTVLGASGYIGGRVVARLREDGAEVFTPTRDDASIFNRNLGHVIYAIGLTADFRSRPYDTARAHVSVLTDVLEKCTFESITYLSSTRVYGHAMSGVTGRSFNVDPSDPSDLYNLTKLTGESLCLNGKADNARVIRLSNVVGSGDVRSENFIDSLVSEAMGGRLVVRSAPESSKDYIHIEDVAEMLPRIAASGRARIYNLASGVNVTHKEWTDEIASILPCEISYAPDAPVQVFPSIDVSQLIVEFGFSPRPVLSTLAELIAGHSTKP